MEVSITRAENDCQIEQLLNISKEIFGEGYLTNIPINNTIIAFVEAEIVGFGYFYLENSSDGVLKTFAIKQNYQNKGIGSRLLIEMESKLISFGAKRLIVPAWKDCNGINIERLLVKFGYKKNLEIFDYWKKDCDKKSFSCPSRTNKCNCSAVFFSKSIQS